MLSQPPAGRATEQPAAHLSGPADPRLCHALAIRLPASADRAALAAVLASAGAARLWTEDVPAPSGSAEAARHRERELRRTVDPRRGTGLRGLLLRYTDREADLVLVAHRAVLGPDALRRLGTAAAGGAAGPAPVPVEDARRDCAELVVALTRIDALPGPDWGLGDPGGPARFVESTFALPGPDVPSELLLMAALGLVLSRCTGTEKVRVAGVDPRSVAAFEAPGGQTVGDYLAAVDKSLAAPEPAAGPQPLLGLLAAETGDRVRLPFLAPTHPLAIGVVRDDDSSRLVCRWSSRHFHDEVAARLIRMVATVSRSLAEGDQDTPLGSVELLDAAAGRLVRELGGAGTLLTAPHRQIHREVSARAAEAPDRIALCYGPDSLTYRELERRSDRVARALQAEGVGRGSRVGVCLDLSLDLVVVLLAVLKAGAAYVPMNPGYPADRLAHTAADAATGVVVTTLGDFPAAAGVVMRTPESLLAPDLGAPLPVGGSPEDTAYVIYTSGSTGRPKGVAVPHRNVGSLLDATRSELGLGRDDVWTLFHSVAFDFSVWEIWGCLTTGGRLVVVPYWVSRSPDDFRDLLASERVTVLNQTPSAFAQLRAVDRQRPLHPELRLVVLGGEPLDTGPLCDWFDRHPECDCRVVNMFGITETTVHVTAETVTRRAALGRSRSVGRALPGWSVTVLDPEGRLLPPGVAGEIHVGGAGVARHYLNLPELTAERFLEDPATGARSYRSGDLGRMLPDGRIEHLGRLDDQVQLRGHRIELGEIRARLLDDPAVAAAAVLLRRPDPQDPASTLVAAYVVPTGDPGTADCAAIRQRVGRFLPDYMVPSTVTPLAALPLTANGKVDAARLPEPTATPGPDRGAVEHDGTVPDAVRAIWTRVFGVPVGPTDDFFDLGGNSLLAVRLLAAVRAEGLPPASVRELYLSPGVADFTRRLVEAAAASTDYRGWLQPQPALDAAD